MTSQYTIKGINDDTDICTLCGKTHLKKVVWLSEIINGENQEPAPYGTTCAGNLLKWGNASQSNAKAKNIQMRLNHYTEIMKSNANESRKYTESMGIVEYLGMYNMRPEYMENKTDYANRIFQTIK